MPTSNMRRNPWLIWLIAGLFYLYEFVHRVAPSVMVANLMQDFNVSAATLGVLSACYFYSYALLQIPAGLLLDTWGPRILLFAAALLLSISSFIFAQTSNLVTASIARLLIGSASAFSFIGCLKLCATWFPAKRFPLLVGLTNVLGIVGAILGGHPLAVAVEQYHWRNTLLLSGYIGVILSLAIYLYVADQPNTSEKQYVPIIPSQLIALFKQRLYKIAKKPQIWLTALYGCFMVAPIAAFAELWGVSYLMTSYRLTKPVAALITSSIFFGIAIGGPSFGWISGQLARIRPLMGIGTLGALLTLSTVIYYPHLSYLTLIILLFSFGAFTSIMLLCFSLNSREVEITEQALSIGLTNTIVMFGSVLSQPLIGKILDYRGQFTTGDYQMAFLLLPFCHLCALLILYWVKEK